MPTGKVFHVVLLVVLT